MKRSQSPDDDSPRQSKRPTNMFRNFTVASFLSDDPLKKCVAVQGNVMKII